MYYYFQSHFVGLASVWHCYLQFQLFQHDTANWFSAVLADTSNRQHRHQNCTLRSALIGQPRFFQSDS